MGFSLAWAAAASFDLGDCPHTVFVLLQLPTERGGGLVQVRNCGIQILDGVQRMGFQIVHRPFDFLKVSGQCISVLPFARPIAALLVAEVEVIHQQVGQHWLLGLFQCIQKESASFHSGLRSSVAAHESHCGWTASGYWRREYPGSGLPRKVSNPRFSIWCAAGPRCTVGICWMPCRSKERRSTRSGRPAASK